MTQVVFLFFVLTTLINCSPLTTKEANDFLYRYGYLQPAPISAASHGKTENTHEKQRNAISKFQEMSGLRVTGQLDPQSLRKMTDPRCGVPDVEAIVRATYFGWKKRDLTFKIENYYPEMAETDIRKTIRSAFDAFSAVTPLKFSEVDRGNANMHADMLLRFERDNHGDGLPFDGRSLGDSENALAHAFPPSDGRIHFDSDELWTVMSDDNLPPTHSDLKYVAIHEIGHALGLKHVEDNKHSIMHAAYKAPIGPDGRYNAPTLDEGVITKLRQLYPSDTEEAETFVPKPEEVDDHCLEHVYGVLNLPGHRIVFFPNKGKRWAMFNTMSKQMVQNVPISEIFKNGPSSVTAAYYNRDNERIVLFHGNQVWAYDYFRRRHEVLIGNGYPKNLPVNSDWKTEGALHLQPNMILVNHDHMAAYYNEDINTLQMKGHINDLFPSIPKEAAGFAESDYGRFLGYTQSHVFKFHRDKGTTEQLGEIAEYFTC